MFELDDPYWGQVRLERWSGLHEKKGTAVTNDVVRACAHREREKPSTALWLAWLPPEPVPVGIVVTTETIWQAYIARLSVETGIRFRKETLGRAMPRFHSKEFGDHWTELIAIVC